MEAEVLTTDTWGMSAAPEDVRDMPDTINDHNHVQPEAHDYQPPEVSTGQPPETGTDTFRDLGVAEPICAALEAAGMTTAFPIQALAVPIALDGQDLI